LTAASAVALIEHCRFLYSFETKYVYIAVMYVLHVLKLMLIAALSYSKFVITPLQREEFPQIVASGGGSGARPPFKICAPSFHVWPPGCCIHPILY